MMVGFSMLLSMNIYANWFNDGVNHGIMYHVLY